MKKLVFLGACLVALASAPARAQAGGADLVVVRVEEYNNHTHLTVERAGQAPEEIEFKWDSHAGKGERASKGYLDALGKLYQQGYLLQAAIPGAVFPGGGSNFTTLVFYKSAAR